MFKNKPCVLVFLCFFVYSIDGFCANQLLPADAQALTGALDRLALGWDEPSVAQANTIFANRNYTQRAWKRFFNQYFVQSSKPFTGSLGNYLSYPVFFWLSPQTHTFLQNALVNPLLFMVEQGLKTKTWSESFFTSLSFLYQLSKVGISVSSTYEKWMNDYFSVWKYQFMDPYVNGLWAMARTALWINYADTLPVEKRKFFADAVQLTEPYYSLFINRGILIHDNNKLLGHLRSLLVSIVTSIPSSIFFLKNITVSDLLLRNLSFPFGLPGSPSINTISLGYTAKANPFPSDIPAYFSDTFSQIISHELNHSVDAFMSNHNPQFAKTRQTLLQAAGLVDNQYLRSQVGGAFFQDAPQEFFASIGNEWMANSEWVFTLALSRFNQGFKEPLRQAIFYADAYSAGTATTWFYKKPFQMPITAMPVSVTRDAQNRIIGLQSDTTLYSFVWDATGQIQSVSTQNL